LPEIALIVGASSGVGRAIACELARRGYDLVLAARDPRDLEAVAWDLEIRWAIRARSLPLDLADPELDADTYVRSVERMIGAIEVAVLTAGMIDERDSPTAGREVIERLVRVNYLGTVQLISALTRLFRDRDAGTIIAFSSIAAAAPRKRNTVYSSAKSGLETYCQGLQHLVAGSGVCVQVYALGYVDTGMAFGQHLLFPVASPERVARHVVANLGRDVGIRYFPRFWGVIVRLLALVPRSVYRRLNF